MPDLNDMQVRYASKGLTVIGMSVDETGPAPVKALREPAGVRFTVAMANDEVLRRVRPDPFDPDDVLHQPQGRDRPA